MYIICMIIYDYIVRKYCIYMEDIDFIGLKYTVVYSNK